MNEKLKKYLDIVNAINQITDDLIVAGSLAQYLHLKELHRSITDIDIILFNNFQLSDNLDQINNILSLNICNIPLNKNVTEMVHL